MDTQFFEEIASKEINRGNIYWSAIPYSEARPFKVFSLINNGVVTGKKTDEDDQTFAGFVDETGRRHSEEIEVLVRHKRRLSIIVQDNEFNHDEDYEFVYVVPITTFASNDKKALYFKDNPDIAQFHYIGKLGSKHAVANISDIKRIHKTLLLESTTYDSIGNSMMTDICKKIGIFMEIDEIQKCDDCKYNYKNYIGATEESV